MIPAVWPSTDLDLDLDLLKAVGMTSVPAGHKSVGFGSLHHYLVILYHFTARGLGASGPSLRLNIAQV